MSAKDWSEWRWAFSFYGVENWLLLRIHGRRKEGQGGKIKFHQFLPFPGKNPSDAHVRIVCGTKRLNPFFRLHEASEVLNKYAMGVWPNNFTAAVFVSFIMAVFVPSIEGIQNKVIRLWIGTTSLVNVTSTCSDNLYGISHRKASRRAPNLKEPRAPKMKTRLRLRPTCQACFYLH